LRVRPLQHWLFLLPPILLLLGGQQAFQYWLNRKQEFRALSAGQATQALGTSFGRLAFGWFGLGAPGLILGTTTGLLCINGVLSKACLDRGLRGVVNLARDLRELAATARRYGAFPIYYCGSSVLNTIASGMPVFFINRFHSSHDAGQYNLAVMAIGLP